MASGAWTSEVRVLERCSVAIEWDTVPPALPLTVFDVFWLPLDPFRRVFLYSFPLSTAGFHNTHIPNLKRSLSLALQRFYPLAGKLIISDGGSGLPCVRCSERDAVELTVAESGDELNSLAADAPKASSRFRGLVPTLPMDQCKENGLPVLAVQVTLFPEQGISVGLTFPHAIMDGLSAAHFMRTWASFCRGSPLEEETPFFDRRAIMATEYSGAAVVGKFMANLPQPDPPLHMEGKEGFSDENVVDMASRLVRATFRLNRRQIEALRRRVDVGSVAFGQPRFSSFALVTALAWATHLKARGGCSNSEDDKEWFLISCDLRGRLPDVPTPRSYFGNVIGQCVAGVNRADLLGPDGLAVAVAAVRDATRGLSEGPEGAWNAVKAVSDELYIWVGERRPFMVAGSPWLGVYRVDFGWGRPQKTEVLTTDRNGAVVLAEGKEEDGGGLEINVVLPAAQLGAFSVLFEAEMAALSCPQL